MLACDAAALSLFNCRLCQFYFSLSGLLLPFFFILTCLHSFLSAFISSSSLSGERREALASEESLDVLMEAELSGAGSRAAPEVQVRDESARLLTTAVSLSELAERRRSRECFQ